MPSSLKLVSRGGRPENFDPEVGQVITNSKYFQRTKHVLLRGQDMTVAVRASAWRNSKERIVERAVASVQSLRAQDLKDYQALVGDGYVSEQLHIHFELPMLPFYVEDPFFNSRESPIAALSRVSVSPNVVRHGYKELARHAAYCHPSRHVDTSFESPSCVAGPTAQKAVQRAVYILNRREKALDFER